MSPVPSDPKHRPNRLRAYFQAHDGKLRELEGIGFVISNNLSIDPKSPSPKTPFLKMKGNIQLAGNLRMDVEKLLRVQRLPATDEYQIYTVSYSYSLVKNGHHTIFRYCSAHDDLDTSPHHHKFHHKHVFDPDTGNQRDVHTLTEEQWPTLGEVLDEAKNWQ